MSPIISPTSVWLLAFIGLGMPYLLFLKLIFTIYWIFRGQVWFLVSLLVIGIDYQFIPKYLQLNFENKELSEKSFKVMSFKIRVFDLYLWTKEKSARNLIFDF